MGKLAEALRLKYKTPQDAIRALGLDESLLRQEIVGDEMPRFAMKMNPIAYGQGLAFGFAFDAELGGANSSPHPAKHAEKRADIAARTGVTGGPSTHKGTGEGRVRGGKMRMPSGIDWPSRDDKPKWFVQIWYGDHKYLGNYEVFASSKEEAARNARAEMLKKMPVYADPRLRGKVKVFPADKPF